MSLIAAQERSGFALQSLRADAYDHYSAIYSLLCDRLKRHKNLRIAPSPSIPRTVTFPTSANIQVHPLGQCSSSPAGQPVPYLLTSGLSVGVHPLDGEFRRSLSENLVCA